MGKAAMREVVVGVDGCRGGWLAIMMDRHRLDDPAVRLYRHFQELLTDVTSVRFTMAVDMPIGLLQEPAAGGRRCDRLARALLGHPRGACVFSPPIRDQLHATSFADVRGLSRQSFAIVPKIAEVDRVMTPALQRRILEAHPELAFARLAGHPMRFTKTTEAGRQERLQALRNLPCGLAEALMRALSGASARWPRKMLAQDDLLDAAALVSTAWRHAQRTAARVPRHPDVDRRRLRMEIWY